MALMMVSVVFGQTAADPGEGLRIDLTSTPGVRSVKWWGRTGRTYFVQSNPTLNANTWSYMPVVETGADAIHSWNLSTTGERMFVRLVYTDQLYSGSASLADFDGDGLTNAQEVAASGPRSNPLSADTDDDGFTDSVEWGGGYSAVNASVNPDALGGSLKLRANRALLNARHVVSQPVLGVEQFTLRKTYLNVPNFQSQPLQTFPERPPLPALPAVPHFGTVSFDGWALFDPYSDNPLATGYHHDVEYNVVEEAEYDYSWGSLRLEADFPSTRPRLAWIRLDSGPQGGATTGETYLTAVLPPGVNQTGDFEVQTPVMNNSTAQISVGAAGIQQVGIRRDEDVPDSKWESITGPLAKALPGQKINLSVIPGAALNGVPFTDYAWVLPDKVFKNYEPTQTTGTITPMAASDKTGQSCSFYFADSGTKNIQVSFKVNGQAHTLNTTIDVQAPIATMDPATTGEMRASISNPGYYGLLSGLTTNTNPHGIDFAGKVEVPQGFPQGEWCFAQVVRITQTRVTAAGVQEKLSLNDKNCLDDVFPYGDIYTTGPDIKKDDDSPMDPIPPLQNFTCSNSLTMYLMFKPAGSASCWVALKSIAWGFGYSASLIIGSQNYIFNPAQASQLQVPGAPQTTNTQPEWEARIQSATWVPIN